MSFQSEVRVAFYELCLLHTQVQLELSLTGDQKKTSL